MGKAWTQCQSAPEATGQLAQPATLWSHQEWGFEVGSSLLDLLNRGQSLQSLASRGEQGRCRTSGRSRVDTIGAGVRTEF